MGGALKNFIFGVNVEVEFSPLYEGQPLFGEVNEYMKEVGFTLFDINLARLKRKTYKNVYSRGQIFWGEALYFKDPLANKNLQYYPTFQKAIKNIAVAEFQGFSDFAQELLDFYHQKGIINNKTFGTVRNMLARNNPLPEYKFIRRMFPVMKGYLQERFPRKHKYVYNLYNVIKKRSPYI